MKNYFVFVLASRRHRYLTIDVVADLANGVRERRGRINRQFGKKRVLQKLVYIESVRGLDEAVDRYLEINRYSRAKLEKLIGSVNPCWESISITALECQGFMGGTKS